MTEVMKTLVAEGSFPFEFKIEKAIPVDNTGERLIIEGVASTANIDHDNERMSRDALESMARVINEKTVPLRVEHDKSDSGIVGMVFEAIVDDRNQLIIKSEVDPNNKAGVIIYKSLKNGTKLGFSVGGDVKKAVKEFSEKTGRIVKTFYDVTLKEVSLTLKPANYDSYCFNKHIIEEGETADKYRGTALYNSFLFENRNLDYIYSFEKSIPDSAWKREDGKINSNIEKAMDPKDTKETKEKSVEETETKEKSSEEATETKEKSAETETKEKSEETKETKEKSAEETSEEKEKSFVTQKSFADFQKTMIESFAALHKAMGTSTEEKEKSAEETEAKEKSVEETDEKKEKSAEEVTETKEKSEESETKESYKTKAGEQKEDQVKDQEESEYAVKLKSVVKSLTDIFTKSEQDSDLDKFTSTLSSYAEKMEKNYESNGVSIPGFRKMFVEFVRNDPAIQEELGVMMKSMDRKSVAFMTTKDGQVFEISPRKNEVVQKSENKPANFKDTYKENFSGFQK